jgi:hypothetical protein
VNASYLYHFIGDLQEDERMPAVVLYEHDERGSQLLDIAKVSVVDGRLVIEVGSLHKRSDMGEENG